jgi:Cu/Zn superoxide dismutase
MLFAEDGTGRFEVFTDAITFQSGTTSVFDADGSALIVHAGIDELRDGPPRAMQGTELPAE